MGRDFYDRFPRARGVFEEADRALNRPLSKLCFEGPQEELQLDGEHSTGAVDCEHGDLVIACRKLSNRIL